MVAWPSVLNLELQDISPEDFLEPEDEACSEHDHVVGEMSEDCKRIFTLLKIKKYEAAKAAIELRFKGDSASADLKGTYFRLKAEERLLEALLWLTVEDEHSMWDKPIVGVRKGWKVVWSEHHPGPMMLRGLFGGLNPFGED